MPFPVDGKWIAATEEKLGVRFPCSSRPVKIRNPLSRRSLVKSRDNGAASRRRRLC